MQQTEFCLYSSLLIIFCVSRSKDLKMSGGSYSYVVIELQLGMYIELTQLNQRNTIHLHGKISVLKNEGNILSKIIRSASTISHLKHSHFFCLKNTVEAKLSAIFVHIKFCAVFGHSRTVIPHVHRCTVIHIDVAIYCNLESSSFI